MFVDRLKCSIIIGLTGDFYKVHRALAETLLQYQSLPDDVEAIIILDGPIWETLPLVQILNFKKNIKIIKNETSQDHLGAIYNQGLNESESEYVTFLWPGVIYPLANLLKACSELSKTDCSCVYTNTKEGVDNDLVTSINYGWLQCSNLISLAGAVFKRESLNFINGFKEDPYLQRFVDWDLYIRISKLNDIKLIQYSPVISTWEISELPYRKNLALSVNKDTIHRTILSNNKKDKLKVTVTGGYWEATHNQLCFFNYFESARGKEQFTWKTIFDFSATESELVGSDLVIISRGKHPNVLNIIDYCEKHNIPTLYMIDDNWFTVAEDWPIYEEIFSPGKPAYDVFIESLKRCNAVMLYSPVLEKYVMEYARKIIRLDINISLNQFEYPKRHNSASNIIGYSGSPRYSEYAFEGLNDFLKVNQEWNLLIFGVEIPSTFKYLKDSERIHFIGFKNYHNYAKTIAEIKPDILLAPLDDTRSSKSKCPNKFLEITAAGAVGIYSDLQPYSDVVVHNTNGILIPEHKQQNPAMWFEYIHELASNETHRKRMYQNALDLVKVKYETESRYEEFLNAILTLIKEGVE